jgi:uncharacterized protein involved in outer membrane biogenesis
LINCAGGFLQSDKVRTFKKVLVGAATAVAILIAALFVAPFAIPSGFIAGQIASLVFAKTGRDVRITGPISFSLLPSLGLVAHDVTLANPPGAFSQDFLTAETVDVALKPLALLHGALAIDLVRLSQPKINFEVDKNGESNWIFHPARPAATAQAAVNGSRAPSFATGDMTIVDGEASYVDQRGGKKQGATGVDMTVSLPSVDGPLNVAGTATYNGETVTVAMNVAAPGELRMGGPTTVTLDLASPRGNIGFNGEIGGRHPLKATGAIAFKTPSLRDLLTWMQFRVGPDDRGLGPLSIDGRLEAAGANATLTEATVTLNTTTAKGTLALTRQDRRLEFDLNDMTLYGGKGSARIVADIGASSHSIAATVKLTGITVRDAPINIAGFDTLSGTGDVSFDLIGSGDTMRDIIASLNGGGRIDFANGSVGSAGLGPLMKNALGPVISDKTIPREIEYRSLSASATIQQGVLRNNDLKLSGPQLSATGAGTLDLAPRRIDYLWQPDIAGLGSARVAITGTWDNPEYKVESVNIITRKGPTLPGLKLR